MSSSNIKNFLKPDQWFNDARFNLIIRPKGLPEEGCKPSYKVQSLIFQMKSPFFAKEIEKLYSSNSKDVPILELPESFNHGVYEDIHMELMGYQARKLRRERILDYYFISFALQLEDRVKYLKYIFDQSPGKASYIWEVYGLACKIKDEDLRDELLRYLESKTFKPLISTEKDEQGKPYKLINFPNSLNAFPFAKELNKINEDDFKFLIKIHNDKRHQAKPELQKEFLNQTQIFELCRNYTKMKGFGPEKSANICKELMVMALLTSDEFETISKHKFFSSRDEAAILQTIFKRQISVLKKESEIIRNQVPKLEEEIFELRQRLENIGAIVVPKVFQRKLDSFEVQGHEYLLIDKIELPRGKYVLTITFYGKHKHNNQAMFWMYLYLYKNGVSLNSYPNAGWYGYNPDPAQFSPYQLVHIISVDADMELIEFKGYSGGSYDVNMNQISIVAKEIIEDVGVRPTPGRQE